MIKALVTGDAGTIGKELVKQLSGHEILGLDKAHTEMIAAEGLYTKLRRDIAADSIRDEIEAFKPEIVFHLAASFERTKETPEAFSHIWHNDTLGSHRLLEVLKDCESVKTVIFASSYLIYENGYAQYVEDAPILPRNLCGYSKLYTEKELAFLCSSTRPDIRHVNARIFRVYGHGSKSIINAWCFAKKAGVPTVSFNEENRFDFIHARDVAEGLKRLAFSPAVKGTVNLGTGISRSIKEVYELIGLKPEKLQDDLEWESSCADISKLKMLTGWQPGITLEDGIRELTESSDYIGK